MMGRGDRSRGSLGGSVMTRKAKRRGVVIGVAIVAALVAGEVGLNLWVGSKGCVQVENLGAEPIEGLVVACASSRATAPTVAPGKSVKLYLTGAGASTLQVSFRQNGNGMTGYQLPGFDPALMAADGSRLVLQIRPNEVIRFQDEAGPTTPMGHYVHDLWTKFWDSLDAAP